MDPTNLILFITVLILATLVFGMWFVLSTRLKSANEQVMKTSTHMDEQVQSLANLTSSKYAPITTVEDIARDLHEINQTLLDKTENLKNSLTFTNEETKQQYMKNLAEVNLYSQDYATKSMAVKTQVENRLLDVEENTRTWQQTQNQLYSDFTKNQNKVLKQNQEITEKVFKSEQELLRDSRDIKKVMHYVADQTSVLNDFTIKTRDDMNKKINDYNINLNKIYDEKLGKVTDTMSQNDFLIKTNINQLNVDLRREQARLDKVNSEIQDVQATQQQTMTAHKIAMDRYQETADDVLETEKVVIRESQQARAQMTDVMNATNSLRDYTVKTKAELEEGIRVTAKNAYDYTTAAKTGLEEGIRVTAKNASDYTTATKANLENNLQTTRTDIYNNIQATRTDLENNIKTTDSKTNTALQNEVNRLLENIRKNDEDMKALQNANINLFKGLIAQQQAMINEIKQTTESQFKANDAEIKAKINEIISNQSKSYAKLIRLIQDQEKNYNDLLNLLKQSNIRIDELQNLTKQRLDGHEGELVKLRNANAYSLDIMKQIDALKNKVGNVENKVGNVENTVNNSMVSTNERLQQIDSKLQSLNDQKSKLDTLQKNVDNKLKPNIIEINKTLEGHSARMMDLTGWIEKVETSANNLKSSGSSGTSASQTAIDNIQKTVNSQNSGIDNLQTMINANKSRMDNLDNTLSRFMQDQANFNKQIVGVLGNQNTYLPRVANLEYITSTIANSFIV